MVIFTEVLAWQHANVHSAATAVPLSPANQHVAYTATQWRH